MYERDYDKVDEQRPSEAIDELALQNVIRKRYCNNWPDTILQLTKRVQAVNQTWAKVVNQVMTIPGLSISWTMFAEKLAVRVSIGDEHEQHEITAKELHDAQQYVEVLIMDKLDHSELIARHSQ